MSMLYRFTIDINCNKFPSKYFIT